MDVIKLRPHHCLCIQFFKGIGYSEDFTKNMYSVISLLKNNPEIEIMPAADMLCAHCPKLCDGDCENYESVGELDKRVLDVCEFKIGQRLSARDFFGTARKNVIDCGKLCEVCGECQFMNICGEMP